MSTSSCPQCGKQVTIPSGVGTSAKVRCPLCHSQYTLADALVNMPPLLELVVEDVEDSLDTQPAIPGSLIVPAITPTPSDTGGADEADEIDFGADEMIEPAGLDEPSGVPPLEGLQLDAPLDLEATSEYVAHEDQDAARDFDDLTVEDKDTEVEEFARADSGADSADAGGDDILAFGSEPTAEEPMDEFAPSGEAGDDELALDFGGAPNSESEGTETLQFDEDMLATSDSDDIGAIDFDDADSPPAEMAGDEMALDFGEPVAAETPVVATGESEATDEAAEETGKKGKKKKKKEKKQKVKAAADGEPRPKRKLSTVLSATLGGLLGLIVALYGILWLGPDYDFLGMGKMLPSAMLPGSFNKPTYVATQKPALDMAPPVATPPPGNEQPVPAEPALDDPAPDPTATPDAATDPLAAPDEMPAEATPADAAPADATPPADAPATDAASAPADAPASDPFATEPAAPAEMPADEPAPAADAESPPSDAPPAQPEFPPADVPSANPAADPPTDPATDPFAPAEGPDMPADAPAADGVTDAPPSEPPADDTPAPPEAEPPAAEMPAPSDDPFAESARPAPADDPFAPSPAPAPAPSDDPFADSPDQPDEAPEPQPVEPLGPVNATEISPQVLSQAIQAAEAADRQMVAAQGTAAEPDLKRARSNFYVSLFRMADGATFVDEDADAGQLNALRREMDQFMRQLASDPKRVESLKYNAGRWLDFPRRTTPGIILAGKVQSVEPAGKLHEIKLNIGLANAEESIVSVLSETAPAVNAGDDAVVLGTIVDDPAQALAGYEGSEPTVVWNGMLLNLSAQ